MNLKLSKQRKFTQKSSRRSNCMFARRDRIGTKIQHTQAESASLMMRCNTKSAFPTHSTERGSSLDQGNKTGHWSRGREVLDKIFVFDRALFMSHDRIIVPVLSSLRNPCPLQLTNCAPRSTLKKKRTLRQRVRKGDAGESLFFAREKTVFMNAAVRPPVAAEVEKIRSFERSDGTLDK